MRGITYYLGASRYPDSLPTSDYEAKVVEEITQAAGVRTVPTRDQLNQFVQRCATLDCWLVAQSLEDALGAPAWQTRLVRLSFRLASTQ